MAPVTSVEYKVKCLAFLSYSTLADLAEYFHLSPIWGSNENLAEQLGGFHFGEKKKFDFVAIFDLPMDEQKCCAKCKHNCYACVDVECEETVDCVKYPCENCGKVSNNCRFRQLRAAIIVFKSLLEVCSVDNNYDCFESENEYVFSQFPFCYSVELLWDKVNTALEYCLDFLMKTGFLSEEVAKDRLMDIRLILKRSKSKVAAIFGDEVCEMFPELTVEKPAISSTDDEVNVEPSEDEAPVSENYYYNLPNGKKVWLKKDSILRKTFTLVEKIFDGAVFKYEIENRNVIKTQYQIDNTVWVDIDSTSHGLEFQGGNLILSTSKWQPNHRYDVRLLLTAGQDLFHSLEYYGCTVKERCSQLNDEELKKNWTFDELKRLVKSKDVSKLKDIFSASKKLVLNVDGSKNTLLHWAAQYSSTDTAEMLLQKGLDVFSKNKEGATAYHQAANYGSVQVMKILLAHNKKGLNEQDSDLYTPLHYACLNNCFEMTKYLTEQNGINVDLRSKKGKKPDEVYAKTRDDIKRMIAICRAKQ